MSIFTTTKKNENYWRHRKINWVKEYFSTWDHPHRQAIIKILKEHPVRSVLEVGCGAGENLYLIKKHFPEVKIAGCDISEDAIETAKQIFREIPKTLSGTPAGIKYEENPIRKAQREFGEIHLSTPNIEDIEFKVGSADALPFHGDSFDLVLTDAMLIYIGPDKITRVLREIRRVTYNKMMFVEFHHKSFWKRLGLRMASRYYAYDYSKLLPKYNCKYVRIMKMSKELWSGEPWETYGSIITSIR